jgi:hypothetical protein
MMNANHATQASKARQHGRRTPRSLAFLALCVNLLAPSAALAADGVTAEQAGGAGAGTVAVLAAAEAERRRRKRKRISTMVTDDAVRFGWDAERIRRESVAARRALALKVRR